MGAHIIVAGGGNAALSAAISARRAGAGVTLLEAAPVRLRGGNSRHTRDIRFAHDEPVRAATGIYTVDEFFDDLLRVTGGETNRSLAELTLRASMTLPEWMQEQGILWQEPLKGTLHLSRTNGFFLGGGKQLVNTYYDTAQRLGVRIRYEATVKELIGKGTRVEGVVIEANGVEERLLGDAVVVAAGGFEANIAWLREYWGEAAERFVIRGTPYNKGKALEALYAFGANRVGDPKGFHSTAVDARAPQFDGGIITRIDSIPFGIAVNLTGRRFYDEGEELWPKRYAIWGKLIAEQPGQTAFAIFDAKTHGRFIPSLYRPLSAGSIAELAELVGLDPRVLTETIEAYNAAIVPGGTFEMGRFDDCRTLDLDPPKSHWALPIDTPPYFCYPLRPGITFTYLGVEVNERAQVLDDRGNPFDNLYAAGECMAGNILSRGYLAGFGLTIGTVFGRIAGTEAARRART